jgi:DNA (cytosine-5)-methyltransferase 3A
LKLKNEIKPKWFILENVASMPKKDRDIITREMGVEPIMIDAALVSAQSRKRLFWTNIPVKGLPEDKGIKLKDILQPDAEVEKSNLTKDGKSFCIDANYHKGSSAEHSAEKGVRTQVRLKQMGHVGNTNSQGNRVYDPDGKSVCLSANGGGRGAKTGLYNLEPTGKKIRKLTPVECERLQCLPDNYTAGISNTQRYRSLGNGFNVEVIKFILSFL